MSVNGFYFCENVAFCIMQGRYSLLKQELLSVVRIMNNENVQLPCLERLRLHVMLLICLISGCGFEISPNRSLFGEDLTIDDSKICTVSVTLNVNIIIYNL